MGSGGTSGMVTDGSEIFRLDNLESVVGGTCGASDRSECYSVLRSNIS